MKIILILIIFSVIFIIVSVIQIMAILGQINLWYSVLAVAVLVIIGRFTIKKLAVSKSK